MSSDEGSKSSVELGMCFALAGRGRAPGGGWRIQEGLALSLEVALSLVALVELVTAWLAGLVVEMGVFWGVGGGRWCLG